MMLVLERGPPSWTTPKRGSRRPLNHQTIMWRVFADAPPGSVPVAARARPRTKLDARWACWQGGCGRGTAGARRLLCWRRLLVRWTTTGVRLCVFVCGLGSVWCSLLRCGAGTGRGPVAPLGGRHRASADARPRPPNVVLAVLGAGDRSVGRDRCGGVREGRGLSWCGKMRRYPGVRVLLVPKITQRASSGTGEGTGLAQRRSVRRRRMRARFSKC